jgi:guanine deaminase
MASLQKTIYAGAWVHCQSLTTLDICPNGSIGVDERGKIAFVLRDTATEAYPPSQGWEAAKIVRIADHGFFFPGFIGM